MIRTNKKRKVIGLSLALALGISATSIWALEKDAGKDGTTDTNTGSKNLIGSGNGTLNSIDAQFAKIATLDPYFGGMFFDKNGDLTVYLQAGGDKKNTQLAIESVFGKEAIQIMHPANDPEFTGKPTFGSDDIRVIKAKYSFNQLAEWKRSALMALNLKGMGFIDIDEEKNAITIGITDADIDSKVLSILKQYNVPADAINIEITEPMVPFATQTLQDDFYPQVGGIEIQSYFNGSFITACTLGFTALRYAGGRSGFVTPSHCTAEIGEVTFDNFYMSTLPPFVDSGFSIPDQIGFELLDPPLWTSAYYPVGTIFNTTDTDPCPKATGCRYSDSIFAAYYEGDGDLGKIARTKRKNPAASLAYPAAIEVDPINPTFQIEDKTRLPHVLVGTRLSKMGMLTGWSEGKVKKTCASHYLTNLGRVEVVFKCQNTVGKLRLNYDYNVAWPGDSGAPVFFDPGTGKVYLQGMLIGGYFTKPYYVYSPIQNIEYDLGELKY